MTTYQAQHIAALEKALSTALFHQSCLDDTCHESVKKEHASHVARKRRALNKAIKEATQ